MNRAIFSLKSISLVAIFLFSASGLLYGQAIWDGSTDNDWDDATNWTPANVPNTPGEFAVFDGAAPISIDLSNLLAATNITTAGILFDTTSNYTINPGGNAANSLTMQSSIVGFLGGLPFIITLDAGGGGAHTINADMILNETLVVANFSPGDLALAGDISGAGGLFAFNATAPAILSGSNTYTGATTVAAGTLEIQNAAGLGSAASGSTVVSGASLELALPAGFNVIAEPITLNGTGAGATGALINTSGANILTGTTTLASNSLMVDNAPGALLFVGNVNMGANTLTIQENNIGGTFGGSVISGSGAINKTGTGRFILSNANTYTGATTVAGGTLEIRNGASLGTAASGTTVQSGASLELALPAGFNVIAESITLNGTGAGATGALINTSGANILTGTTTLASDSLVVDNAPGALFFFANVNLGVNTMTIQENNVGGTFVGSVISGSGGIIKTGAGTWFMNGTASNTFTGDTTVNAGTMSLGKTAGLDAISGANINLNAGTLLLAADNQIANTTNMNLNGGTFSTAGFDESLATLTLNATSTIDVGAGGSIINYTIGTRSAGQLNITSWAGLSGGGGTD